MIIDTILSKKIKIWLNLPLKYRIQKELTSQYGTIVVVWESDMMIICSIFIYSKFRSCGIFSNLLEQLEQLNINIKLQSILNKRLYDFMLKRNGWKKMNNELSIIFIKKKLI